MSQFLARQVPLMTSPRMAGCIVNIHPCRLHLCHFVTSSLHERETSVMINTVFEIRNFRQECSSTESRDLNC
jgi:hypothetical protein